MSGSSGPASADAFVEQFNQLGGDPPMRDIFALAKRFVAMPVSEVEALLEQQAHALRVGAVSIMDWQARSRRTSPTVRAALFELYVRRHDRIDNWDLVDRAAPSVVGGHLIDKPRDPLYAMARSASQWPRRTSIVATYHFIRHGEVDDTFAIAEILAHDTADLVQKAVGGWVREAGNRAPEQLLAFLDTYAATMPRTALRYAIERLPQQQRHHYLSRRAAIGNKTTN
ncbi:DNA alkylation repair protein [Micromonospora andamanensis]|uniref:DNA alkylation repair protein n=1 Tax=Micromonospora andamanensis TaxID=1287068 RepID=A0ABQ4I2G0_9ACTN|nr:DNA alkylation repair protein [Micromonospora andamanensis]GIJ12078.1 hypothetical protein Van01_52920 [Micromonospora andamanensis]GIJ42940.1 hypothetical protein Vwe01_62650 [Micromonospora andamanensis]